MFRAVDDGEPIENFPDKDKEIARISEEILSGDSKRYVNIPVIPSFEGYNLMVEFIEGIEDEKIK